MSKIKFSELGLSDQTMEAINKKGFEEPTEVQAITIPMMLKNEANIIAQAQTGTGKTAAFGLPLIEMIDEDCKMVQALILVPTRELAIQVSEEINSLKGKKNLIIIPIYGGQSIDQQLRRLKKGVHIVVGTPGRVIDHLNRKKLNLQEINHLIFDEADEMLNMGFIEDMEEIMKHTSADKKTLLFSATMPYKIKELAKKYMDGYELITIKREQLTTNLTDQIYFEVKASDKFEALCRIVDISPNFYGLIFCRTKIDVDGLTSRLADRGYDAEAIHGDISQIQRERTLDKFKKQKTNILVATDVAARGIDVNNLTHVINFSLPQDPELYIHRIGRTGRAGNRGTAITFITPSEYRRFMFIQRVTKNDIKKSTLPKIEEIIQTRRNKINDDIAAILAGKIDKEYYNWAKTLLGENNPTEILAAILSHSFEDEFKSDNYNEIKEFGGKKERPLEGHGKTRLFVALGKKDNLNARKLVDLIMGKVQIKSRDIRDIEIMENFSFLTVPFNAAEDIIMGFEQRGKRSLVSIAKNKKREQKRDYKRR